MQGEGFRITGGGLLQDGLLQGYFMSQVKVGYFGSAAQVPKLAWTCKIFLAHGQDLTLLSCVQGLGEKICPPAHF